MRFHYKGTVNAVQENNRRLLQKSKRTHTMSRYNAVILKHVVHTVRIVFEVLVALCNVCSISFLH